MAYSIIIKLPVGGQLDWNVLFIFYHVFIRQVNKGASWVSYVLKRLKEREGE